MKKRKQFQEVPVLSHLQAAVLACLGAEKVSGRELRRQLVVNRGLRKSGPAFYQLMARLEESGFVTGEYSQKVINGQIIKERNYRISAKGAAALTATRDFYASPWIAGFVTA